LTNVAGNRPTKTGSMSLGAALARPKPGGGRRYSLVESIEGIAPERHYPEVERGPPVDFGMLISAPAVKRDRMIRQEHQVGISLGKPAETSAQPAAGGI
jgi:hypothetical protein